ncbi:hypothetical protein YQE_05774, partial [Dendroctonus ponderosae]
MVFDKFYIVEADSFFYKLLLGLNMHTDLSAHLHTDKCNQLITDWRQCRSDHMVLQLVGYCNSNYSEMLSCLKEERIAKRTESLKMSSEWKSRVNKMKGAEKAELN